MNKEQAVSYLRFSGFSDEQIKAIEDAFTYDDCISREAVKYFVRSLSRWYVRSEDGKFTNVGLLYDDVMFGIDRLPSVNPQKPICPSAGIDCEDCPAYEKKSEWEHDHEILKAYSDGASAVLESIKYLIEQYEHYLELLDADMKDGSATIVTKTKYAVYTEVVKQLKEVLESEVQS